MSDVSSGQMWCEWSEARQMLNDAGYSDLGLPAAVELLLEFRLQAEDGARARHPSNRHLSNRRRADLSVVSDLDAGA